MTPRRISRRIFKSLVLIGMATPSLAPSVHAEPQIFPAHSPIVDDELDQLRGGFVLPNGMDVMVGIDIQTLVNGTLALRTVLNAVDGGVPAVFTGTSSPPAVPGAAVAHLPGGVTVQVVQGAAAQPHADAGQLQIDIDPNGPAVLTQFGSIHLAKDDSGSAVTLANDSLELRHMIGNFTGSIVANTANDRSIDTVVTVNVDLQNSAVPIGNAMLRWDAIAVEAAGRSIR